MWCIQNNTKNGTDKKNRTQNLTFTTHAKNLKWKLVIHIANEKELQIYKYLLEKYSLLIKCHAKSKVTEVLLN